MIRRLGRWAIAYIVIKWLIIGSVIYWLSRYEWFRFEYLAVLPLIVLSVIIIRK